MPPRPAPDLREVEIIQSMTAEFVSVRAVSYVVTPHGCDGCRLDLQPRGWFWFPRSYQRAITASSSFGRGRFIGGCRCCDLLQ